MIQYCVTHLSNPLKSLPCYTEIKTYEESEVTKLHLHTLF